MNGQQPEATHSPAQPDTRPAIRWQPGVMTLAGLVIGAAAGGLAGFAPVGIAAGLAAGVGIDSLLNNRRKPAGEQPEDDTEMES
jgi:hypothetical protein